MLGFPNAEQLKAMEVEGIQQFLDGIRAQIPQLVAALAKLGETHRARITMPADGKGGVIVE